MLKSTKNILPVVAAFFLIIMISGCTKDEVIEPCPGHEEPVYRGTEAGGEEEGNGGDGISDGGDEESDSERNTKQSDN